jgi:hypothetical protein
VSAFKSFYVYNGFCVLVRGDTVAVQYGETTWEQNFPLKFNKTELNNLIGCLVRLRSVFAREADYEGDLEPCAVAPYPNSRVHNLCQALKVELTDANNRKKNAEVVSIQSGFITPFNKLNAASNVAPPNTDEPDSKRH